MTIEQLLDSVILEDSLALKTTDGEFYNYLPPANKLMRRAENVFGHRLVAPIIERLVDKTVDGPSVRIMMGSLMRLVPTRQSLYEDMLTLMLPNWRALLRTPQRQYAPEFAIASDAVTKLPVSYPNGLVDGICIATRSQHVDVAVSALRACEKIYVPEVLCACLEAVKSGNEVIRQTAIRIAARLSRLNKDTRARLKGMVLESERPMNEKIAAFEAWLDTHSTNLNCLIELIVSHDELFQCAPFLNGLLDMARLELISCIEQIIDRLDVPKLPNATLRRVARMQGLNEALRNRAASLALNILEVAKLTSRFGLIAHRNSHWTASWVGHAGIFVGEDNLIHCTTGNDPNAVHVISFNDWKEKYECWGIREDANHAVDLAKAVNRAHEIDSWRTEYDGAHNNQKGEWKYPQGEPPYWETDCVGFTEHCYEHAGGDPTPNEYESGSGWPLTVREQRDAMRKVADC